jgi:hypothetical protein
MCRGAAVIGVLVSDPLSVKGCRKAVPLGLEALGRAE